MNIDQFFAGAKGLQEKINIPEWFVIDPHLDRFVLIVHKEEHSKINFGINSYEGCLPEFWTKVAGVTKEGREAVIRKMHSYIKNSKMKASSKLVFDTGNEFHNNAIKVMVQIINPTDNSIFTDERHVGYIPRNLANFIRFAELYGIRYDSKTTEIKSSKDWVSVKLTIRPEDIFLHLGRSLRDKDNITRIPIVSKRITGATVEDFRKALIRTPQKRKE